MKICASRVLTPKNKTSSRVIAEINDAAKIKDKSGMASERDEDWPSTFGNRAGRS
jgi:hypothetical protein